MRPFFVKFLLIVVLLSGTTSPVMAEGTAPQTEPAQLADQIDLSQMRGYLEQLDTDVLEAMPEFSLARMFEDLKSGKLDLNPENIGKGLMELLGRELLNSAPLIGKLLILAVLCAVLGQLQAAYSGNVGKVAQFMTYLVLISLALTSFQEALSVATETIDRLVGLMQTLFPVMLTLLISMGNLTSAALFKPIVMGSLTVLATMIKTIVLPLFFLAAIIRLFNHISEQFKLTKLAGLLEFAGKISLGVIMTVFIGVMTVQGVTGGVADSVVFRTAKYSADLVPVVGKFFKDAVELVITSALLLKNAVGMIAMIAIIVICVAPVVKILVMILVFRISAALIEPLGENALADSLQDMSKSLVLILVTVACVVVMFFMTVAVVVGTGTFSVMLH